MGGTPNFTRKNPPKTRIFGPKPHFPKKGRVGILPAEVSAKQYSTGSLLKGIGWNKSSFFVSYDMCQFLQDQTNIFGIEPSVKSIPNKQDTIPHKKTFI